MKFSHNNAQGVEVCSLILSHLWADVYGLIRRDSKAEVETEIWVCLIQQAQCEAKKMGAKSLLFRLIEEEGSKELSRALPTLGFAKEKNRIEYRCLLKDLPDENGSPFQWKTSSQLGWSEDQVASLLVQVGKGEPEENEITDPITYMQDWLKDPVLTSGPQCIAIGMLGDIPSALVVAQVNLESGWSRISYMGLIPERRGQNLGHWIHKHGFSMMREQGGELYHGGTASHNKAMIRLFQRHGCEEYQRMEEWVFQEGSR